MLIEGNLKFKRKIMQGLENIPNEHYIPKFPAIILTSMDPRIDIHRIFQINSGDIFIFRNAGNVYTKDALRSLLLIITKFNIKYIIVLGHLDCFITKISLKELRDKLPTEFLSQLSKNYSLVLTELNNFFKPFSNEIENVKSQIKNLDTIKSLYPKIEITGMIYDIKTGLVFEYDLFKDYKSFENYKKVYQELIVNKKDQFTNFIINNKLENISSDISNKIPQEIKLNETDGSSSLEMSKDNEESNEIKIKSIMPRISVPKIQFHKVKIYIPTAVRKKKK
jgi:carbonic anhydrase